MRKLIKKLFKDVTGNVLLITGAGSFALVGGAGLAVDTVQWYLWKRQLQQAVDSGALAGGQARSQGSDADRYARKEVNRNANTTVAIVRIGQPLTGSYTSDTQAVEVIATTSQALPFSSVFLANAPTIRARAVATTVSDGEHCVISLAPDGVGVNVDGSADVQLGCGVAANSADPNAIDLGGSSYLNGTPLSAVGGIEYASGNIPSGTTVQPYGVENEDPIAARGLTVPSTTGPCTNNFTVNPNTNVTVNAGPTGVRRFCNGMTIRGTLTMQPGVYIMDRGAFAANSQANITGQGVTIILTGNTPSNVATIDIAGGAEIDLRAPTALENADWQGILFYQDPIADFPLSRINGGSDLDLEGIIYMPSGNINFNGSSGQHAECLLLVANRVSFSGESSLDNNCPADYDDLDLSARIVRVVE